MTYERFRVLGWMIPIICTATSGWFIYREHNNFDLAGEARNKARIEAQQIVQEKKLIDTLPDEQKYATVVASASEEYTFVTNLRAMAIKCGVKVSSWSSDAVDAPRDNKDSKNADPLLKGIVKIPTSLTLVGPYSTLRSMISTLENSDRLLTLSNLYWARQSNDMTSLSLTVTRYVVPATDQKVAGNLQIKSN